MKTSPFLKRRFRFMLPIVVGAVLLVTGLVAVVFLNSQNQDLRQQAAGGNYIACETGRECPVNFVCIAKTCQPQAPSIIPTKVPTARPTVRCAKQGEGSIGGKCCAGLSPKQLNKNCGIGRNKTPCPEQVCMPN